jgi:hypothetical protein
MKCCSRLKWLEYVRWIKKSQTELLLRCGWIYFALCLMVVSLSGFSYPHRQFTPQIQDRQDNADSVIWVNAVRFATLFNNADTAAMENFLPENFMLQILHQNFLGKRGLLNIMTDTAVQKTFQHLLHRDANTVIQYSDNHQSACLNVAIDFINSSVSESKKRSMDMD